MENGPGHQHPHLNLKPMPVFSTWGPGSGRGISGRVFHRLYGNLPATIGRTLGTGVGRTRGGPAAVPPLRAEPPGQARPGSVRVFRLEVRGQRWGRRPLGNISARKANAPGWLDAATDLGKKAGNALGLVEGRAYTPAKPAFDERGPPGPMAGPHFRRKRGPALAARQRLRRLNSFWARNQPGGPPWSFSGLPDGNWTVEPKAPGQDPGLPQPDFLQARLILGTPPTGGRPP